MIRKALATLAFTLTLAACNPVAAFNDSEAQVTRFHQALTRGDNEALYAMTGSEFRRTTNRAQFDDLLTVIDARLGAVQSSERTNFNVNTVNGNTITTIVMNSRFEKGEGQENFVFSGTGEDMRLEGWHVLSPQLALTAADVADEQGGNGKTPPPPITVAPAK